MVSYRPIFSKSYSSRLFICCVLPSTQLQLPLLRDPFVPPLLLSAFEELRLVNCLLLVLDFGPELWQQRVLKPSSMSSLMNLPEPMQVLVTMPMPQPRTSQIQQLYFRLTFLVINHLLGSCLARAEQPPKVLNFLLSL